MLCPKCKQEHTPIKHVLKTIWKGEPIEYPEEYLQCGSTKVYTEQQLTENWRNLARAERKRGTI